MRRNLLFTLFLFSISFAFAQDKVGLPHMNGDTLFTSSGYPIVKKSELQLGEGTANDGAFEYIKTSGANWESLLYNKEDVQKNKITRLMAHEKVRVVEIRAFKKKNKQAEYFVKVEYGFSKYWCDIENAIKAGEVIIPKFN